MTTADAPAADRVVRIGPLDIAYDDSVLTPRRWTETQSRWAADLAQTAPVGPILELCSGAGHIGLLAILYCDRDLVAVDLNPVACAYAERNAADAGLSARFEMRNETLETACAPDERFPVIIADPPWVPEADTSRFPEDPLSAIDGGADGLSVARACLAVIGEHLAPGGSALLQLGTTSQVEVLRAELPKGLELTEVREEGKRGVVALVVHAD